MSSSTLLINPSAAAQEVGGTKLLLFLSCKLEIDSGGELVSLIAGLEEKKDLRQICLKKQYKSCFNTNVSIFVLGQKFRPLFKTCNSMSDKEVDEILCTTHVVKSSVCSWSWWQWILLLRFQFLLPPLLLCLDPRTPVVKKSL